MLCPRNPTPTTISHGPNLDLGINLLLFVSLLSLSLSLCIFSCEKTLWRSPKRLWIRRYRRWRWSTYEALYVHRSHLGMFLLLSTWVYMLSKKRKSKRRVDEGSGFCIETIWFALVGEENLSVNFTFSTCGENIIKISTTFSSLHF